MDLDTVPCGVSDVNVLLMSKGGKCSLSSRLVFQSPAFTSPDMFLGEPELLLVVVLFCKSRVPWLTNAQTNHLSWLGLPITSA